MKNNIFNQNSFKSNSYISFDKEDKLNLFRDSFHIPNFNQNQKFIYLSGNSLGLQLNTVSQYVNEELDKWKNFGVEGHTNSTRPWLNYHEILTTSTANIVGALEKEVVVMNSLTVNLHLLMASFYRPKGKRKKILIEDNAFPSDRFAVQSQLKFHGQDPKKDLVILKSNESEYIKLENLTNILDKCGNEIALILIGGVNYYTGQSFDLRSITNLGHMHGCYVGFDLAHSAGNVLMRLHDWEVDFAAWCGYKYLNGGPGAPSGVFIHENILNMKNVIRFEGWWGNDQNIRFKMRGDFKPIKTAEAWQLSNPPILSMAALLASLELFNKVGMKSLREKSEKLSLYLEFLLNKILKNEITIITPKSMDERGCQISFRINKKKNDIINLLYNRGVICDWREPDIIRVAPVPFYNTFEDCNKFVNILKEILDD
tara:strand:- start:6582 stop:7865 length:1284 start_codon:yes stop_codon:yes gene_type:complete